MFEDTFVVLFSKLVPLYITGLLGYIAGIAFNTSREDLSKLMFFLLNPMIVFHGILHCEFSLQILSLPIVILIISCLMSFLVYTSTAMFFKDHMRNIIAFSSGGSSIGYFGLPVAMMLFDDSVVAKYIAGSLGMLLYENSFGFYMVARGKYTMRDSVMKFLKLPTMYAGVCAFILIACDVKSPEFFDDFMFNIRRTYTVLGMMMVGLGIAAIKKFKVNWLIVFMTFIIKYMLWPLIIFGVICIDKMYFNFYDDTIYRPLVVLAIVPISVSNIIVATVFKYNTDEISVVVLLNTLIGMFYVPAMVAIMLH